MLLRPGTALAPHVRFLFVAYFFLVVFLFHLICLAPHSLILFLFCFLPLFFYLLLVGGNVLLSAGSTGSTEAAGGVISVGSYFLVRPPGAGASSGSAQLRLATVSDGSQYYTVRGDPTSMSILSPAGATIFSIPVSGTFTFNNAIAASNQISVSSLTSSAVFAATSSSACAFVVSAPVFVSCVLFGDNVSTSVQLALLLCY